MKRSVMWTMVVVAVTGAVAYADGPGDERDVKTEYAYRALQEAVDLVRSTHVPDGNIFVKDGEVRFVGERRPRIGVVVRTSGFDDGPVGAVIDAVTPGGPADEAGLVAGDVITHVDGRPLVGDDSGGEPRAIAGRELVEWSRGLENGQRVTIDYVRDGASYRVTVEAREMDAGIGPFHRWDELDLESFDGGLKWYRPGVRHWAFPSAWLDMELVALNPELGEYFASDHGVLVVRAPEDDSLGLEAGDVVLAIGGRNVRDPSHAMRILRSYEPGEELAVDIVRHGRSQTLVGTVPTPSVELLGMPPKHTEDDH